MLSSLLTCNPGYENHVAREAAILRVTPRRRGEGWMTVEGEALPLGIAEWCFAHTVMPGVSQIAAPSRHKVAEAITDHFCSCIRDQRVDVPWPLTVFGPPASPTSANGEAMAADIAALLRKRMSRVAKLAIQQPILPAGMHQGLFIFLTGADACLVSRECWYGGQRRMRDDPQAPSRSYLKAEEAYGILGDQPEAGESVVDLGAAPGGWSYSAAKRGARVTAVDNGPLKGGALGHPYIAHVRADAFTYQPDAGRADWLFCDMVEDPERVLELVRRWLQRKWCDRFVVNLKFGRSDALQLLDSVRSPRQGLAAACSLIRTRHLFHDREEFTVVGRRKSA